MKSLLKVMLLLFSVYSYAQIDNIETNYKNIRKIAGNYYSEVNRPNKYFHYQIQDGKENYYIYLNKNKYDSLVVLKLDELTTIKNSNVYSKTDKGYYKACLNFFRKRVSRKLAI